MAGMRLYPAARGPLTRTVIADLVVLALLIVFAWAGMKVHDTVLELNVLSRGVQDAGNAVDGSFRDVASAVRGIPIVGGALADSLSSTGGATGGNVAAAGQAGEEAVSDSATVLGWVTFLAPTLVLLALWLPLRIRQVLRMHDAGRMLAATIGPGRRRLLAQRAAFGLDWSELYPHTRDPIGDLEAGRYDPLVAALYARAGQRPPQLAAE
jgi:hypothetical protein